MNPALKRKTYQIIRKVREFGGNARSKSTGTQNTVIIYNEDPGTVALLSFRKETKKFKAYLIDINKWIWAEEEGFSRDQIVEELRMDIFSRIKLEDLPKSLL